jgi:signal peptidase II
MLYMPLWECRLPDWFPFWGGKHTVFFSPIFNIADAAISVGVVLFILMQRKQARHQPGSVADPATEPAEVPAAPAPPPEA